MLIHPDFLKLFFLSFFQNHNFINITNSFTFIRLRRTKGTNFSCNLSQSLFIGTTKYNFGLTRSMNSYSLRHFINNRMRKTQ